MQKLVKLMGFFDFKMVRATKQSRKVGFFTKNVPLPNRL
jgi:hypothetical protein